MTAAADQIGFFEMVTERLIDQTPWIRCPSKRGGNVSVQENAANGKKKTADPVAWAVRAAG